MVLEAPFSRRDSLRTKRSSVILGDAQSFSAFWRPCACNLPPVLIGGKALQQGRPDRAKIRTPACWCPPRNPPSGQDPVWTVPNSPSTGQPVRQVPRVGGNRDKKGLRHSRFCEPTSAGTGMQRTPARTKGRERKCSWTGPGPRCRLTIPKPARVRRPLSVAVLGASTFSLTPHGDSFGDWIDCHIRWFESSGEHPGSSCRR